MRWERPKRIGGGNTWALYAGNLQAPVFEVHWAGGAHPWRIYGYLPGFAKTRPSWRYDTLQEAQAAAERVTTRFLTLITQEPPS